MKKPLALVALAVMLFAVAATANAGTYPATFPDGNAWTSWDRFSWDGSNSAHAYYNYDNDTIAAAVLDSYGTPITYYYIDLYSTYYDVYYSLTGSIWTHLGSYQY